MPFLKEKIDFIGEKKLIQSRIGKHLKRGCKSGRKKTGSFPASRKRGSPAGSTSRGKGEKPLYSLKSEKDGRKNLASGSGENRAVFL